MQENGSEKGSGEALSQETSRRPKRRAGRAPMKDAEIIWVSMTLSLILFLVLSSQLLIFIPYFVFDMPYDPARMVSTLAKVLIPFNVGAALILINYYKCVTMDAGSVPVDYNLPEDVQRTLTPEETRYCRVCKIMKPPRSHHCRTCKRCVLRMDHHCPWIANCVGQANYASFMRFLAAVDITCAGHLVLCGLRVADYWWTREGAVWRRPSTFTMVVLILNFALCIPTFALVGAFSIYHFWCLCTNTTTIEGWERDKVERLITKGRIEDMDYPFDLGILKNIQSVLGRTPLTWCIPSTTCGDGLHFEVDEGIDDVEQYRWPPRDPARAVSSHREDRRRAKLPPGGPFTYGNDSFNPALQPSNGATLHTSQQMTKSTLPPWHPDYGQPVNSDEESLEGEEADDDAAQAAGVDTGNSCLPPGTIPGSQENRGRLLAEIDEGSDSDDESSARRPPTSSRVRRGSEGYEVRPKQFDIAYAAATEGTGEGYRRPTYDDYDDREDFDQDFDDDEDDDEDSDIDGKQWDWRRQKEEEDRLRAMLEDEMRRTGATATHDPPADWQLPDGDDRAEDSTNSSSVLLPSQIMRRRNQWHQFMSEQPV